MRKLLVIVVLAVAALLVYTYTTTGELRLLPARATAEERALDGIEKRLDQLRRQVASAGRAAGAAGADMTTELESARAEARRLAGDLDTLQRRLREQALDGAQDARGNVERMRRKATRKGKALWDRLTGRADQLQRAIEAFRKELE